MSARSSLLFPEKGLHALLVAIAVVHPSERALLLDLEFSPGLWRRARVGRALPPRDALEGRWQVALHLRTDSQGQLRNPLALVSIVPAPLETAPPRWEVLGQVVRVEEDLRRVVVRVLPPARKVRPFLLVLSLPERGVWSLPRLTRWHFAGRLEDERLVLEAVWAFDAGGERSDALEPAGSEVGR